MNAIDAATILNKFKKFRENGTTLQPSPTCPEGADEDEWFFVSWPHYCDMLRRK